ARARLGCHCGDRAGTGPGRRNFRLLGLRRRRSGNRLRPDVGWPRWSKGTGRDHPGCRGGGAGPGGRGTAS
ncbi:hypothetical protein NJB14197_20250, partial [Mycobacterium montefiorense]